MDKFGKIFFILFVIGFISFFFVFLSKVEDKKLHHKHPIMKSKEQYQHDGIAHEK